ncbi:MAG: tetratricopeptide repeat protein [Microcoleaceae cyanobacterium]
MNLGSDSEFFKSKIYQQINQYLDQDKSEEALESCYQAFKQDLNCVQILRALGITFQRKSEFKAAFQWYEKALEIQPDSAEVYTDLGNYYFQQQQWSDAILAYRIANRLQPCSETLYNLGHAFIHLEQWDTAVDAFQNAIQLEPNSHEAYYSLGYIFSQAQDWNNALVAYQNAVKLNSTHCWYYYELGNTWAKLKRWNDAIFSYCQAIDLDSTQDWFYQNLGNVFQQVGDFEAATIAYQEAIEIQPHSWYYLAAGTALVNQQKWEDAIFYLVQSLHLKPDEYGVFIQLGKVLEAQGNIQGSSRCQTEICLPQAWLKQYFQLPQDWQTTLALEPTLSYTQIYSGATIYLASVKPKLGQEHSLFQQREARCAEALVVNIPQGRVWADSLNISILTSNNRIITELSTGCAEVILSSETLTKPRNIQGRVAFLSVQFGLVYYHWILDVIPRIHLLSQMGYDLNTIDWFVVNQLYYPYEQESLELLNIPKKKIIESRYIPHIQASELVVPFYSSRQCIKPPQWAIKFLRKVFLPLALEVSDCNSRRIYISRQQASYRKLINEGEVIDFLQGYGFQSIQLELLSQKAQVAWMKTAKVVIAAHGSGLTNIVFCEPGTKIIEILSPVWVNPCYWHLSSLCQLDYYHLFGEVVISLNQVSANQQDFRVDLSALIQIIQLTDIL